MAHKKGQGSVRNGRDSLPKRRGLKAASGQTVTVGSIIVTDTNHRQDAIGNAINKPDQRIEQGKQ